MTTKRVNESNPKAADADEGELRRRAIRRLPVLVYASFFVLAAFVLSALLGHLLPLPDPNAQDLMGSFASFSWQHPLGTDQLGRDLLARIVAGSRYSLAIGLGAITFGLVAGVPVGMLAGLRGGWIDKVFTRVIDVLLAFPGIVLALAVVAVLGPGLLSLILAVGLRSLPVFARIARGEALVLREREYVHAATSLGAGTWRVLRRHVLPNISGPLLVICSLQMATAILIGATLTFLGVGMSPEVPEWGAMMNAGRQYMLRNPHIVLVPGITLMVVMMSLNIVGDFLRDTLDPHAGRRG